MEFLMQLITHLPDCVTIHVWQLYLLVKFVWASVIYSKERAPTDLNWFDKTLSYFCSLIYNPELTVIRYTYDLCFSNSQQKTNTSLTRNENADLNDLLDKIKSKVFCSTCQDTKVVKFNDPNIPSIPCPNCSKLS